MLASPQTSTHLDNLACFIRAAGPSPWISRSNTFASVAFTLLALVAPPLLYLLFRKLRNMQHRHASTFPFMELPPELRDMVYEYLLEDPYYPPPPTCTKHHGSPLNWMLPGHWPPVASQQKKKPGHRSNWIFLANKQTYAEYMDVVCKKATFHLTVSPNNYPKPAPSSTPSSTPTNQRIWNISPETLKQLRKCDIKLVTTSSMLGVEDPRNMNPTSWGLARQIRQELSTVKKVREVNLHVKAIGDPLWNPLWVWYHASQSFKTMGTSEASATDTTPAGPKLNRITFSLDTWSPGENYLERDPKNKNAWAWWCMRGHCVGADGGAEMTVREFCARLYMECRTCRPELESDDEDDE